MQINVCGTCAEIKSQTAMTPIPDGGGRFVVPITNAELVETCEACYVPTLNMVIKMFKAAGTHRGDLTSQIEKYETEQQAIKDAQEAEAREAAELENDDSPASEEIEVGAAHKLTLDQVNGQLASVSTAAPKLADLDWGDFTELGKTAVLAWARPLGKAGSRGTPKKAVMAEFVQEHHDDISFFGWIRQEVHAKFRAAV